MASSVTIDFPFRLQGALKHAAVDPTFQALLRLSNPDLQVTAQLVDHLGKHRYNATAQPRHQRTDTHLLMLFQNVPPGMYKLHIQDQSGQRLSPARKVRVRLRHRAHPGFQQITCPPPGATVHPMFWASGVGTPISHFQCQMCPLKCPPPPPPPQPPPPCCITSTGTTLSGGSWTAQFSGLAQGLGWIFLYADRMWMGSSPGITVSATANPTCGS
jgi:hypothetical protein